MLEEWRSREEERVLERWREETAQNGRGVSGWAATMEAASDGRVDCLLAQEGANRDGWQCPQCGRVAAEAGACPLDGTEMEESDAGLDLAVHQTLAHGGTIWVVQHHQRPRAGRRNRRAASLLARLAPPGPRTEYDLDARDGRTLRVAEYGDQDGFPILFSHGTPGSRLDRHPDPATYAGYRLVSYDRPGYGGSTRRPERDVAAAAEDVAAIADQLEIDRFSVFGVSGGGPHALGIGALLGHRVERVAVRCGAAPMDDPEFDPLEGIAEINVREVTAARESEEAITALLEPFAEGIQRDPGAVLDEISAEVPEVDKRHLADPQVRAVTGESFVEAVRQGPRGWVDDDRAFVRPWGFALADVERGGPALAGRARQARPSLARRVPRAQAAQGAVRARRRVRPLDARPDPGRARVARRRRLSAPLRLPGDDEHDRREPEQHADRRECQRRALVERRVLAAVERLVDLLLADERLRDEPDPDRGERDADHLVRPRRPARQLRHEAPRAEADREARQPGSPPGEVGALVREPRPAGRVTRFVDLGQGVSFAAPRGVPCVRGV